ncbi:MAG: CYTH domain-containing protein [Gammaproteobacteria bacterium]|nr:CYTH domain-containing protein [Gammaproteobacteria bacterium]
MATEIERKFLVVGDRWRAAANRRVDYQQGYLHPPGGGARASVRVRLEAGAARLNIKAAVVGAARAEYDYPLPRQDATELLALCVGRVVKTRHFVPHAGHLWEIDEFGGDNAGLVVAEIELRSADEAFTRPPWLGEEVTEQARYYNHALAFHPFCRWPDEFKS